MFLISLGNSSRFLQLASSKVCKLCSLQMELGSRLILYLPDRLRNLKSFKVPIELGNTLKDDSSKLSTCKYLYLEMHASNKETGSLVSKIIVRTLLNFSNCVVTSRSLSKNDKLLQNGGILGHYQTLTFGN